MARLFERRNGPMGVGRIAGEQHNSGICIAKCLADHRHHFRNSPGNARLGKP
ncbi:hypothetical protein PCASD_19139 [Puccinia coronata f. sp. avenae]|uniref:Uncharacterized protein n=1 Tax=Puccinia coronata f. sp. avenae TaxID=200324 RepID=A0A2N5TSH0_9BASI|nr:hypothetical protein PCASD_19139 [Puccinia coronata f. sp. avenae]